MPSNRLALVSVAAGSALLGWATAGVTAIGADLPGPTTIAPAQTRTQAPDPAPPLLDVPDRHHHHPHGRPGV